MGEVIILKRTLQPLWNFWKNRNTPFFPDGGISDDRQTWWA